MESKGVIVSKRKGEQARRRLKESGLLNEEVLLKSVEEGLIFPIKKGEEELKEVMKGIHFRIIKEDFQLKPKSVKSYQDLITLPEALKKKLPTSYDIIGSVIIIKLPDELLPYKNSIGKALLRMHKGSKTVALDRGVKGEHRIRDLLIIAGKENLETTHIENQVKIKVDPSRVYFSPRLAGERNCISLQVKSGEVVLDMFTGAGPFAITIARLARPKKVYAIDVNSDAYNYLEKNIHINHVEDIVEAYLGDAKDIVPTLEESFDRIIMNHPTEALDFLSIAFNKVKPDGIIHLYLLHENKDLIKIVKRIIEISQLSLREVKIKSVRDVKGYSPFSSIFCYDIQVVR